MVKVVPLYAVDVTVRLPLCRSVLVLQGSIVVFGRHGKMLFRLNAGEANVFEGTPECTGTSVTNDTEVIIV